MRTKIALAITLSAALEFVQFTLSRRATIGITDGSTTA